MKVEFTDKQRVYRSPYYLCTQLWDKLEESIQLSNSIFKDRQQSSRRESRFMVYLKKYYSYSIM